MNYTVQFIGLTYFHLSPRAVRILLPDGRNFRQIAPHNASISLRPDDVERTSGWITSEIDHDKFQTEFFFPPAKITLAGANEKGDIVATTLADSLYTLRDVAPEAQVDPARAKVVGDLTIHRGEFAGFRLPGSPDDGNSAVIGQMIVAYDRPITITVAPKHASDGGTRSIQVRPGTEIAIVNTSRGVHAQEVPGEDHFNIYEQLSFVPAVFRTRPTKPGVPPSPSRHPAFTAPRAAFVNPGCSAIVDGSGGP